MIEQQLGLTNIGVAVPGPGDDRHGPADRAVLSLHQRRRLADGAGYPGAIGYLTPDDMNSVYIAPNTSFDFTLVGFQKLTPEQAEAAWAKEWAALTAHCRSSSGPGTITGRPTG